MGGHSKRQGRYYWRGRNPTGNRKHSTKGSTMATTQTATIDDATIDDATIDDAVMKYLNHLANSRSSKMVNGEFQARAVYHDISSSCRMPGQRILASLKRMHKAGQVNYHKTHCCTRNHAGTWYAANVKTVDLGKVYFSCADVCTSMGLAVLITLWQPSENGTPEMMLHNVEGWTREAARADAIKMLQATGFTGTLAHDDQIHN